MARIGEGQAFTSNDFKKAIYAIRGNNRQTKGMACAVAIEGQNEGSVLLVTDTWNGPESITGCQLNRYSRKKQHFEDYQLKPSRITQRGHFSLVMCDGRDSSFKIKSLHKKCLNVQQLQRDFRVYTIYRDKCIDLELKYSNGGYNLMDNNLSDLTLCGSPIIDGDNSEKYLVGVLTTNTEGKAIPRFLSNGVLEQPVFNTHPTVLPTSREGVSINFSSDANGIPEPTFSWTKDGSAVTASDRVSLSEDNKELSIRNVKRTDRGEYRCVATNNVGTVYSNPGTLAVHYQPEFTENPQSQTLVQGSSITFSSDANGVPEPTFSWTKNGSAVTANDRISLSADNKQLSITNVNRTDSGKYRCVATNNVETVNSNPATLTVQESWIENVITEGPGGYKRKAMAGEPASYSEEPMEVSGDLPGWYREEPMAGPSRKFREESTAEVQGKYRKKPMAEAPGKCSEEPTEKAPGGNIEQPISKEDNRSFNFIFEFRQEEPDKTVVELRCSGNGFTDSDWKDLSEKSVKQACMAVKEALEASGRRVAGVRPSESVVVELHCYTRQSFVSLMNDFESGKVKRRLEEEFEKVGYKGELEVTIINKSDVYRALDQIRAWMAMSKREGEISAAADANKIINVASSTTSYASTKETTNYARLCRLLLDVGSHALRNKFDSIHPPAGLHAVLTKPPAYPILQSLRRKRILNPIQWAKLYPPSPSSVSSKGFDVTLLILLLRNICGLTPPITGWHTLPPAADTSTEANIARVKYYRNHVYGNASTGSVDDATFNTYWQDISNALVGLGADAAAINTLKTQSMDPVIEKHYQELLREWKKDDSSKDRLDEIEEPLKRLEGERKIIESLTDLAGEAKQETEEVKIIKQPQSQQVRMGGTVTLRCKATGYPAPQYRWVKDGAELPDEIDEELTLDPVTMYDSGKYFCLVSNQVNAEESDAADLEVLPSSVPLDILARGSLATAVYNRELKEGYGYARRVPIMIIGQARTGKTSLKKSLKGELFNPNEGSTEGIETDPSYFKVTTDVWRTGSNSEDSETEPEFLLDRQVAQNIAKGLKEEERLGDPSKSKTKPSLKDVKKVERSEANSPPTERSVESGSNRIEPSLQDSKVVENAKAPPLPTEVSVAPEEPKISSSVTEQSESDPSPQDSKDHQKVPDNVAALVQELLKDYKEFMKGDDMYSVIWDFGGQSVFYDTHPIFLTEKAIYILAYDLSRDPYQKADAPVIQGMYEDIEDTDCQKNKFRLP